MSIPIRDEATAAALAAATESQEVRGPDGKLLGRFTPTSKLDTYLAESDVTVEELERILNDPNETWVTPEQVMARLREIDRCSP